MASYGYTLPHLVLPCLALWHPVAALCHTQGELYVIDVSQAVDLDHPKALDFLREDCKHINDYFRRNGVQEQRRVLRKGCDTAVPAVLGPRHYYSNDAGLHDNLTPTGGANQRRYSSARVRLSCKQQLQNAQHM